MIEGETLTGVEKASDWEARLGPGCELIVTLSSQRRMFVIRTELDGVEAELGRWRDEHTGRAIERVREVTSWPLADGGRQVTLDVTLEGGFRFEGDLIESPDRDEDAALETEWVFEGTPGVEMGERG